MARTFALSELRDAVMARGGYRRSTSLTDTILNGFINAGIAEVHDLIVKHNPDFLLQSEDLVGTANVALLSLPADFYKARRVGLVEGSVETRLRSFQLEEQTYLDGYTELGTGSGRGPYRYMVQANAIRLVPTPTASVTLRLWYLPCAEILEGDADEYDGVNGHEDLVIEHALLRCRERDRAPSDEQRANIARLEKRLLSALEGRDMSEPEYLPDLGRGELC